MFQIIYPEKRGVSARQIKTWYDDAVANDEVAKDRRDAKSHQEMAAALHDAGIITLQRQA